MKYDLRKIMLRAWKNFRKGGMSFSEALHRAWISAKAEEVNAQRIEEAKAQHGISETVDTWAGWKKQGMEVLHGSKALFSVSLIWGSKGDGAEYKASFFSREQVQAVGA